MSRAGLIVIREFGKRQILMDQNDGTDQVGILLEGTAFLESMNREGQRRILDYYEPGESFARKCFPETGGVCYVISRARCRAAFVDDRKLMLHYRAHERRAALLEEILTAAQRRAMMHTDILGQRTLRQKLLTYFGYLQRQKGGDSFILPFSYTDCADYLAVDRSAMMRELGRLREEGILRTQGRRLWAQIVSGKVPEGGAG
ncbi:MAG: Crp/Fnr family transcriptional regulator [Eubacteriales bacterium]|nr:Crp/Fnr family transcriptional regulator [Eubacteriales bacterium]